MAAMQQVKGLSQAANLRLDIAKLQVCYQSDNPMCVYVSPDFGSIRLESPLCVRAGILSRDAPRGLPGPMEPVAARVADIQRTASARPQPRGGPV
jgi:hypothetical protein